MVLQHTTFTVWMLVVCYNAAIHADRFFMLHLSYPKSITCLLTFFTGQVSSSVCISWCSVFVLWHIMFFVCFVLLILDVSWDPRDVCPRKLYYMTIYDVPMCALQRLGCALWLNQPNSLFNCSMQLLIETPYILQISLSGRYSPIIGPRIVCPS